MQMIDLNRRFDDPIVQDRWKNELIPHFVGILVGDGTLVSMSEQCDSEECSVEPVCASTIASFLEFSGEFVQLTAMVNRVYIPEIDCHAICGEGQMGNEGFVALVRGDTLMWSAFFTLSNPFYEITRRGDSIIAKSTHQIFWEFPIFEPWRVRVVGSDPAG